MSVGCACGRIIPGYARFVFVFISILFCMNSSAGYQRYADQYATSGNGTAASPWVGWESGLASDVELVFIKGYYESQLQSISLPSNSTLRGVEGSIVQYPSNRTQINPIFLIAAGTSNVVIDGLQFEAGVTIPDGGASSQGGSSYIEIGSIGSSSLVSGVTIKNSHFGIVRYHVGGSASHIRVRSSVDTLRIVNNYFEVAHNVIWLDRGHSTQQYEYREIVFSDNTVRFSHGQNFGDIVNIGGGSSQSVNATFDQVTITDNTIKDHNGTFYFEIGGKGLTITGNNVQSDNLDAFLYVLPQAGQEVDGFVISGNNCYGEDPSGDPGKTPEPSCQLKVARSRNGIISSNNLRGRPVPSAIDVVLSEDMIVASNIVDLEQSSPKPGSRCFILDDTSRVAFIGNQCIDSGDTMFKAVDTNTGITILGNELHTTGSSAITTNFISGTSTGWLVRNNIVSGQSLTGSFGGPTFRVGNIESTSDTGWRIGSDELTDITGTGLTIESMKLGIDSSVTTDTEWDTASEINAATTDNDFATLTASEIFLNKDLSSSTNQFPVLGFIAFYGQVSSSSTLYLGPNTGAYNADETLVSLAVPAMTIISMECKSAIEPNGNAFWTMTMRDDGTDTSTSCTIDKNSSGICSSSISSTISAGSQLTLEVTPNGNLTASVIQCGIQFKP